MGKMHETRYVEGQRINNHFTYGQSEAQRD